jgi:DinB superfamily
MSAEAEAQDRAREYFRNKSTLAPSAIRAQIVAAFDALDGVLASVPAGHVPRRPEPDAWSIAEVVDHLVETYRPGVDELRCLLAGQRPPGPPIPAALQSKAPLLRPWPWLLDELRRMHRDVVDLLDGVPPDFETPARVELVMVVNVTGADGRSRPLHWIEAIDWKAYAMASWRLHAIDHMKQVRKALAALG